MNISSGIFITGTDTAVGKTFIGAGLVASLYQKGLPVQPRKPVESGCTLQQGQLIPNDGLLYYQAVDASVPLDQITPYRFAAELSPPRAAQRENRKLSLAQLHKAALAGATAKTFLVVEGAGGFYSPIADDGLNADLAAMLRLPVLLVAANRLGCINHILLTVDAILKQDLPICHIVLNTVNPDDSVEDNLHDLQNRLDIPLINVLRLPSETAYADSIALQPVSEMICASL
jgi:dethiobiotin synthetase